MKMKKSIWIVVAIIYTFFLTGCDYDSVMEEAKETIKEEKNEKFTLSNDKGYADEYGFAYYIEGTVKNETAQSYSYVQIELNAYDASGAVVGSCLDNINNLEPNGTWKIKAICSGDAKSITSYKLVEFTAW